MLKGRVDEIGRSLISGWVADYDNPHQVIKLVVYVDGVERGRYLADRPRADLRALRIYGDGSHGFAISLVPALSPDEDHEVVVSPVAGTGAIERGRFRIAKHITGNQAVTIIENEFSPSNPIGSDNPRYVIHIGPHKTGTTYLQHAFAKTQKELLAEGIYYPDKAFG